MDNTNVWFHRLIGKQKSFWIKPVFHVHIIRYLADLDECH